MVNLRLGAAFGALTLGLVVFLQLLAMARLDDQTPESSFSKNFNQWRSRASATASDDLFMVGAGQADVTGYVLSLTSTIGCILTRRPAPSSK